MTTIIVDPDTFDEDLKKKFESAKNNFEIKVNAAREQLLSTFKRLPTLDSIEMGLVLDPFVQGSVEKLIENIEEIVKENKELPDRLSNLLLDLYQLHKMLISISEKLYNHLTVTIISNLYHENKEAFKQPKQSKQEK